MEPEEPPEAINRTTATPEPQLTPTPTSAPNRRSRKAGQTPSASIPTSSTSDGDKKSSLSIFEDATVGKEANTASTTIADHRPAPAEIAPGQKADQQDGVVVEPLPYLGRRRKGGPTRSNPIPVPVPPSAPTPQQGSTPLINWF